MDLSVARAVFTSALLRGDPSGPEVKRDDATLFTKTLLKTLNCCTRSDVQQCKSFIVRNILPSIPRTAALTKYLVIVTRSCSPRSPGEKVDTMKPCDENEGLGKIVNGKVMQAPEPAFKRLHVLYILHDVLAQVYGRLKDGKHSQSSASPTNDVAINEHLKPTVLLVAELAACDSKAGTLPLINDLVDFWSGLAIFDPRSLPKLRQKFSAAADCTWSDFLDALDSQDREKASEERRRKEDESKWVLPTHHGFPNDPTAPWHELPAANGLYQKRTAGYPLRAKRLPSSGFALKNGGREADAALKREVSWLHQECLRHFEKYTDPDEVADIDALGSTIWKDPERPTRNYWGWSYEGIAKRKEVAADVAARMEEQSKYQNSLRDDDPIERARMLATGNGMEAGNAQPHFPPPPFDQDYVYQGDVGGGGFPAVGRGGRGGGYRGDFRGGGLGRGRGFRGGRW